jgi:hypothetical protein
MKDYPVKLGTMLFTMVDPWKGHEVEYNRWYERDHYYAGCMIGAWNFAGGRFVATRPLKDLRVPQGPNVITPDPVTGSYLAIYWVLADHHDEWNRWAVDQVNWLHANGRMFKERDHIHTLLYNYEWSAQRDPNGVSAELALDHRFAGLAVVVGELAGDASHADVGEWYRDEYLPSALAADSPVALWLSFTPRPLLADAPGDVPRTEGAERRFLQLAFLDAEPAGLWEDRFANHGDELAKSGLATLVWAAPFIPTVVGTDTYTDQLW